MIWPQRKAGAAIARWKMTFLRKASHYQSGSNKLNPWRGGRGR
jgi:hypothetical protein